jgi:glycine cleavage system H protein
MNSPKELSYSKEHTWARREGETAVVGITDFAQDQLGEVVYVEVTFLNQTVAQNQVFGSIEALKTVSDLFAPLSGTVVEENKQLLKNPGLVNNDPYGAGWIIRINYSSLSEWDTLLTAEQYTQLTQNEHI